jgi:hypothetical protein
MVLANGALFVGAVWLLLKEPSAHSAPDLMPPTTIAASHHG